MAQVVGQADDTETYDNHLTSGFQSPEFQVTQEHLGTQFRETLLSGLTVSKGTQARKPSVNAGTDSLIIEVTEDKHVLSIIKAPFPQIIRGASHTSHI